MGEARLEALSSREATLEPKSTNTKQSQELQQDEEYEYTLSKEEDLEEARDEAEKQMYIFQQPPTGPPPALKQSLATGEQPQFQDYTWRSEDGNQTTTKARSQKQSQQKNPFQDSPSIGKSRTEGSKKAGRTEKPWDEDPDDDPSSERSDAGRDVDRSGSENEPDGETAAEESARNVREITASMAAWEQITGQKQTSTSAKTDKSKQSAKIRDPENCDGNAEKWRDQSTFDQYW